MDELETASGFPGSVRHHVLAGHVCVPESSTDAERFGRFKFESTVKVCRADLVKTGRDLGTSAAAVPRRQGETASPESLPHDEYELRDVSLAYF